MSVQAGRRAMPRQKRTVQKRTSAKRLQQQSDRRVRVSTVKLLVCLAVFLVLLGVKFFFPAGAEVVSSQLTSGLDYKAAFSALGKALTSGDNIVEVFKGISLGGFQKTIDGTVTDLPKASDKPTASQQPSGVQGNPEQNGQQSDAIEDGKAVEAMSPVDILDESSLPEELDATESDRNNPDSEEDEFVSESDVIGADDVYMEELLLRLPTSELNDQSSDDLPENVSYDYYVIEFDYVTPLKGTLTSPFGYRDHPITKKRSFHYGVDIGQATGTIVSAFSSGTVELVGYNSIYGNYVFIRHKDGIITFYGHCSKILVEEGQLVRMGEGIAKVGSTGLSSGPHLHFEVRNGDVILDPLHYVSPEG